jgi:hypothetical protein
MNTILKASCKNVWLESGIYTERKVGKNTYTELNGYKRKKEFDEAVKGRGKGAKVTRTRMKLENIENSFITLSQRCKKDERNQAKNEAKYAKRKSKV